MYAKVVPELPVLQEPIAAKGKEAPVLHEIYEEIKEEPHLLESYEER